MKTSADQIKYEEPGCGIGCGTMIGFAVFIAFIGVISYVDSGNSTKNNNPKPNKQITDTVNTYNQIKDSVCVYKSR